MNWKAALITSVSVAAIATALHQIVATGGTYYFAQVDWGVVNKLPYQEAQEYLAERTKDLNRVDSLRNAVAYPRFWLYAGVEFSFLAFLGIASCWLYSRASNA